MIREMIDLYNIACLVLYAVKGAFFWKYCDTVLQSRDRRYEFIVTEVLYLVMSGMMASVPLEQYVLYFAVINFFCIYLLYGVKFYTAAFHALLTAAALMLGEFLVFFSSMQFVPEQVQAEPLYQFLVNDMLAQVLYLIFLYILMLFWRNRSGMSLFMILVPLFSVSLIPVFVYVLVWAAPKPTFGLIVSLCMVFLTALNLIVLGVCKYILKKNTAFAALQMQVQKEQDLTAYYKMFLEQNENQRILIHDMKKHLQSIQMLYEQGDAAKMLDYISQLSQSPALADSVRVSDNTLLNAIVNRYRKECIENNIAFHTDIRKETVDFLSEQDLTALFGNLLDNALEAALTAQKASSQQTNGQNGLFIELNVEQKGDSAFTMITLVNSCTEKPALAGNGRLRSAKRDGQQHGLGMRSVERVVDTYKGKMQTSYDAQKNTFHTVIMLLSDQNR